MLAERTSSQNSNTIRVEKELVNPKKKTKMMMTMRIMKKSMRMSLTRTLMIKTILIKSLSRMVVVLI